VTDLWYANPHTLAERRSDEEFVVEGPTVWSHHHIYDSAEECEMVMKALGKKIVTQEAMKGMSLSEVLEHFDPLYVKEHDFVK
jgi:hypothetical protein